MPGPPTGTISGSFLGDDAARLFDALGDPVYVHDQTGRFLAVNEAACAALGYSRDEFLTLRVSDVETAIPPETARAMWERLKTEGVPLNAHGRHLRKDGSFVDVELRGTHMVRDGRDLFVILARDVTAQRQAQEVLRDSEAHFRTLIELSPFGIAVTLKDGRVLMANRRLADLLGQTTSALKGTTINDLYVDPQERARMLELYAFRGRVLEHEVRLRTRDPDTGADTARWFLVSWQPTRFEGQTAIVSWFQDVNHRHLAQSEMSDLHAELQYRIEERTRELGVEITERRYAEAALKETNEFLEQQVEERTRYLKREIEQRRRAEQEREKTEMELLDIIQTAPIAMGIAAQDGRFLFWNPMFYKLGRQNLDDRGKYNFSLDCSDPDLVQALQKQAIAGKLVEHVEAHVRTGNGDARWVLVSMRRLTFEGQAAILTWVFDITDMKEQAEALEEARQAAEDSARAKSVFLATMSHEIRTPMNGVITMAEMLGQTRLDAEQRHMLDVVTESANALVTIIDEILDFSKIEAGRVTLETVSLSLTQVVERVADLLAPKAAAKGLDLICRPTQDSHDHYGGDPHRLRQILINLAGNAIKFTEHGHVTLSVSRIDAAPRDSDNADAPHGIRFEVTDTGIGMTDQQMAGLFKPFSQADHTTQRRFGGTGLGLSICRTLVDLMGGRIGVHSTPGKGSTFWFEVPLTPRPERRDLSPPPIQGARAVVVSDSGTARDHFGGILDWAGAEAIPADTTDALKAALMLALVRDQPVDAVILDRRVEDAPALRLVDDILRIGAANPPRILAVVPRGSSETSRAAERPGVSAVIGWPVHGYEVAFALAVALGRLAPDAQSPWRRRLSDRPITGTTGTYQAPDRATAEREDCLVLVAEDNPTNQTVIRMLLDRLGLVADYAVNGVEALALFKGRSYGLVITDCHMPEMDGYELTERIRRREGEAAGARHTPIIALTADAIAGTAQACLERGMDDYLTKPVAVADLDAAITRWLPRALDLRHIKVPGMAADPPSEAPPSDPGATSSSAPAPDVDLVPDAPVLDTTYMADLVGGDTAVLKGLLAEFLESTQGDLRETVAALDDGRLEAARKAAHTVSGAARSAGALRLGTLCKQVEQALFHGDTKTPKALRDSLEPAFREVEAAIQALDG
ncbi:PAS domain S-box protein [uncultured Rhodospira sp.]|uniref:PAS domain S-box protein n=1 Tax=uncultured Rhodospira sp. TaxID=1936189 RepID=UPI0026346A4D|nr:PAS domain S-box protein [uncultured Rhodospira sp.]